MRALSLPPAIRRQQSGPIRGPHGAGDIANRIRRTLLQAQRKLLTSVLTRRLSLNALRAELESRR